MVLWCFGIVVLWAKFLVNPEKILDNLFSQKKLCDLPDLRERQKTWYCGLLVLWCFMVFWFMVEFLPDLEKIPDHLFQKKTLRSPRSPREAKTWYFGILALWKLPLCDPAFISFLNKYPNDWI
jgi:hypothetical protein